MLEIHPQKQLLNSYQPTTNHAQLVLICTLPQQHYFLNNLQLHFKCSLV